MHFPIIELCSEKMSRDEIKHSSLDYDDAVLNYYTDYYGESYTEKERNEHICSEWMKSLFKGIADVDTKNECISFFDESTINDTLDKYYRETIDTLVNSSEKGWLRFYRLRELGREFRGSSSLFVVDGCAMTSMQFFEDCYHYAGKKLYFGQFFDAHC